MDSGVCVSCVVVYNLTNNIDMEETKLKMEQYQRENRDIIQRNKAKLVCTKWSFPTQASFHPSSHPFISRLTINSFHIYNLGQFRVSETCMFLDFGSAWKGLDS